VNKLPASRPPIERFQRIALRLSQGRFPNASTLAREMEVCTATIHRDIEFMRDRLGIPIEYDGARFGYFLAQPVSLCPVCCGCSNDRRIND
jgi:predicted DNA-binding transcriptional regulator YafY